MAREFARKFYHSKAWRICRDGYYVSKFGICERCGRAGVIVHHKIELTPANINDPSITLNWDYLELLCIECHNGELGDGEVVQPGLAWDAEGNLIHIGPSTAERHL